MTTQHWFNVPGSNVDFSSITADAVVRAAQRVLNVTPDGVVGSGTMLALARYVATDYNRAVAAGEPEGNLTYLSNVARLIGTVANGRPLPLPVWDYVAKMGISQLVNEPGVPNVVSGAPVYRGPALTPAQSPAAPRTTTTPARTGVSPSDASASLATRMGAFYDRNRTAVNIAAALLVVGGGVAAYMYFQDGSSGDEGGEVSRSQAEAAARLLQVSIDSDKQSIRAAAARAMGAYQSRSDASRRDAIAGAREVMLRWNAQKMGASGRARPQLTYSV